MYVDDIKLAGKKQNIDPMWKVLNKEVDLGEPTSFLDHVYLGCTQRQCEISKDIVDNYRTMFESRISAGWIEKIPYSENFRFSSWSYDMDGHAKKCVKRYCELANRTTQQLYKVSTPCIDHHHFKEEEMKSVGELSKVCSQSVLKFLYLARIGRPDILWSVNKLARSITKWTKACDKRLNRLISYIHHTSWTISCIAPLMIGSSMIGWAWGWRSLEFNGWCGQQTVLLHSLTGGRRWICGVPVDGISIEDGTDTSTDLVNLSNDSMSTRGKAFTDRAMLLDIQSCTWSVQTDLKPGKESSHKSASHQATVGGHIHGTWYCIAYESHTDGHSWRQKRQTCCWSHCRWVTDRPTARRRVRDQVYITCCCEFLVRSGFLSSRVAHARRLFVARTRCASKPYGWRVEIVDLRLSGNTSLAFVMQSSMIGHPVSWEWFE